MLPDGIAGTAGVVKFIADEISKNTYINIMDQYHPCYKAFDDPSLNRRITNAEYREALRITRETELKRIDGETGRDY